MGICKRKIDAAKHVKNHQLVQRVLFIHRKTSTGRVCRILNALLLIFTRPAVRAVRSGKKAADDIIIASAGGVVKRY
jgi:hypothetical protein